MYTYSFVFLFTFCVNLYTAFFQEACPRYVARQQIQRLGNLGYELLSSFEWEFRIQHSETGNYLFDHPDAYCSLVLADKEKEFCELDRQMYATGIDIETLEIEYGSGMYEIAMKPQRGIDIADQSFVLKGALKEYFSKQKCDVNFMAKPIAEESGNGAHYNHSIWKKGQSVMHDPKSKNGMSEFMCHWLAGLVKHSGALAVLCAPTIHCYRRYHQPWAPCKADWGVENRFVSIRAKVDGEQGTYLENRMPSSQCNPYIVLAATVAAGLDGIEKKLECPKEADTDAPVLPHTLEEGLIALEKDSIMVEALGSEFVEWFCQVKRVAEVGVLMGKDKDISDEEKLKREVNMYHKLM